MSARNGARETTPDVKMNALYLNQIAVLHEMLAAVRCWADSPRKAALIEEYEAQIEEYTDACAEDYEMSLDDGMSLSACPLDEAVAEAVAKTVVHVNDAHRVAAALEKMAPGCGMKLDNLSVWSVRVELTSGVRGELRLVIMTGRKGGSLHWMGAK